MKQLKQLLLVMAIALTGFTPAQAQTWTHYSEWMAYARRNMVYNGSSYTSGTSNADWWRYDDGLMYESILDTYEYYKTRGGVHGSDLLSGVERYLNYSITGTSESPNITNCTGKNGEKELDDMRPGRLVWKYCYTYNHTENSKIDVYKAACQAIMNAPAFQDSYRVGYSDGHHDFPWQHKATYTQQVWLDGIFMGIPYWTLAGPQIGSTNKSGWGTNATKFFDDAVRQMQVTDSTTYVSSTGLWCHAWDYTKTKTWADCSALSPQKAHITAEATPSGNNTGRSLHTWGRALGWYAMAIMETMDNINAVNANYAKLNDMKTLFKKVMDAVISYRDATSGVWYCVMDVGDNSSSSSPYYGIGSKNNYLEATCSSMFAYCLLHGVAKGYLPSSYLDDAKNAYRNVVSNFITTDGDNISLNQCMKVGGLDDSGRDGTFAYYMSEPIVVNDSKGVGPFIWASLEAEKIGYNMETNSFDPIDENTIVTFAWSKASDEITQGASYTSPTFTARSYGNDTPLTNSSEIAFESSNTDVATVAADGTITPVGIGTATITAALKEGSTYTWSGTNPTYTITVNAPDTSAPTLSSSTPTSGAINVSTSGTIVLTFSEAVTVADASKFTLSGGTGSLTTGSITGDGTTTITIPYTGLANETSYTFATAAGAVQDASGNPNAALSNILFTTAVATSSATFDFTGGSTEGLTISKSGTTENVSYSVTKETYNQIPPLSSDNHFLGVNFTSNSSGVLDVITTSSFTNITSISFDCAADNNSNPKVAIYIIDSDNKETEIQSAMVLSSGSTKEWRSNKTGVGVYTLDLSSAPKTGKVHFKFTTGSSGKSGAIDNIVITTQSSTPPTPTTFTLTNTVNTEGYGTVSPTSVASIPSGTATTSSSNTYTVNGTTVTATPATATDEYTYTFSGWSGLPATVTANATVKANFTRTAKEYTLAWNSNGGSALSGDYTSGTVAFGTAITAPNDPTRDGYTFNGWNTDDDGSGTPLGSTMPAANTTYYAQWTENTLPTAPEFSPEEGNVNGGTEVSITSTDATTIYYQISESSTPLAIGNSGWSTYSSAVVLPNITGTRYLHAYGANATGNSTVSTAIYTLTENAGGSTTATYTFDDGRALATDWDVTTSVPTGGTAVCEITNSLSGAGFSAKNNNYLGLAYLSKSGIGITVTTKATYSNITKISIDAVAGDNSKPTFAAYIVTASGDEEVFAAIGSKDGFETGGTNKWGNKTVTLATPLTGKLKIVTTASSSGKYAALDNIAITTEAGASTKVATPTITGTTPFASNTNVTISCDTEEATIYYTTNGDTPTTSSTEYSAPFNISATTTVKAIAVKDGMTNSNVAEETFTLDNTKPTVTLTTPATTTDVAINTSSLVLTVSEDITAVGGTIAGTFDGNAITFTRTNATTLTYSIPSTLTNSKTYNVTLSANQIQDAAGNQNDAANFSFTTAAAAPSPTGTEIYEFTINSSAHTITFAYGDSENISITNSSCEQGRNEKGYDHSKDIKFNWHNTNKNTQGQFTINSASESLKSIRLVATIEGDEQNAWGEGETVHQNVAVTNGTYNPETKTWTAAGDNVTSVTFTNNYDTSYNGNIYINKIIITYYSAEITETITIAEAGFSTLYKTYAVEVDNEHIAYYVSDVRNKQVVFTPFDNNIIPANTGAVIKGTFGDEVTLTTTTADTFSGTNYLLGTDTKQNITADKTNYYYFISGRQKQPDNSYKYGWLVPNALKTTSVFSNNANKAYLQIPKSMLDSETAARMLTLVWEDYEQPIATGIDGFTTDNGFIVIDDNTPLYNLSGQRVSKSYKGIVIVNGKKVLRK